MTLAVSIFLYALLALLMWLAWRRDPPVLREGLRIGFTEFVRMTPRLAIGVVGAGYIAAVLPHALVAAWIGPGSGLAGVAIASAAGAVTPGGPFIGFAIGVAALKGGAGAPQIVAYSTAWALFALHRVFIWEVLAMPAKVVLLRVIVSAPIPFVAAGIAMLLGRP